MNSNSVKLLKLFFEVSYCNFALGAVHKGRPQCGVQSGRVVQCGHFSDKGKGVLQMRTSAFFGAKIPDFCKFMVCPHG